MSVRVFYDILNQKGTPAMYTDTFANRPAYGYQGRLFISTDSGQIFEDTGSAWTLIADAGVGGGTLSSVCLNGNTTASGIVITAGGLSSNSITNTGNTAGSVLFAGTSGLESQSNATFFWDNTNKRLGIGNASPGAPLDVHGTGTQLQLNGTGSSNSYIQFQNAGVSKWRIGNTYSAGANSYGIYNNGLSNLALTINSTNNGIITTGYLNIENALGSNQIYLAKLSSDTYGTIQTETGGGKYSLGNVSNLGTLGTAVITWTSGAQVGINNISPTYDFDVTGTGRFTGILRLDSTLSNGTYFYTLPSATGTLALLSNITSAISGTTNTHAKFTSTNVIGNSMVSDDGTTLTSSGATRSNLYLKAINNTYYGQLAFTNGSNALYGGISYNNSGQYMQFETNTSEWMRLTSGGNFLIGYTTDNGSKLQVNGPVSINGVGGYGVLDVGGQISGSNQNICRLGQIPGIVNGLLISVNTSNNFIYNFGTLGTGSVVATANVLSATSDMNLKVADGLINNALDKVLKIIPRYFYWKEETGMPTNLRQLGFFAQEINECLGEEVANAPKNDNEKWGIYDRGMIAMLTKSIQELNEKLVRNNIN
jgi:hypothetical protein